MQLFDKSYDSEEKLDRKKPRGSIILAIDKNVIGCVMFTWDGWDSSICRMAVHPEYRKQGLGTMLLEEAERRLKKLGADVVSLRVDIRNKEAENFTVLMQWMK